MSAAVDPYAGTVTFAFRNSPELADALLALMLSDHKTATCGALHDCGGDEPVPEVGRRDVTRWLLA